MLLSSAYERNEKLGASLTYLNVSGTKLDNAEGSKALGKIITKATKLSELSLQDTNPDFHLLHNNTVAESLTALDLTGICADDFALSSQASKSQRIRASI